MEKEIFRYNKPRCRGFRIPRCAKCFIPLVACICDKKKAIKTEVCFWLIMHSEELKKPTNTGRLILDCFPDTKIFEWSRTEPNQELINLIKDQNYKVYILFPDDMPDFPLKTEVFSPETGRKPVFIILDGTWNQARKIFRKSNYLHGIPAISLNIEKISQYKLRKPSEKGHLCTVEVAIEVLKLIGEAEASASLSDYFNIFTKHYLSGKSNHQVKPD
jgi:DTW domain-containing protein YfiP